MAGPEQSGRGPVTVIHFPKREGKKLAEAPRRTQTITEISAPLRRDDEATDPTVPVTAEVKGADKRRRKSKETPAMPEAHVAQAAEAKRIETPQQAADLAAFGHQLFELGRFEESRVIFEGLVSADAR